MIARMLLPRRMRLLPVLALCAAAGSLLPQEAEAAPTCTATMTSLNFGDVDLISGGTHTATATLNYTCTNDEDGVRYMRACFDIGNGSAGVAAAGAHWNPRVMSNTAGTLLNFQAYQGATAVIWGSTGSTSPIPDGYDVALTLPARSGTVPGTVSGSHTLQGTILSGQSTIPPGLYATSFQTNHTLVKFKVSSTAVPPSADCRTASRGGRFGFDVSANVIKSCLVSADPLDFGIVDGIPSSTNIDAATAIRITCSQPTAYAVRLMPSNNDTNGAGTMQAQTAGNGDTVAYRLYSDAARSALWGSLPSNDVEGTGTGMQQLLPVYGRVPGLPNVRPDTYQDTVTVNVVY
jgi:spore coat protein U-like protein